MSIRRTRQQKMQAELRHSDTAVRYHSPKEAPQSTQLQSVVPLTETQKKMHSFFLIDMQKTAASTLIVLIMLGVTYWLLR